MPSGAFTIERLQNIENIVGTAFSDVIRGSRGINILLGGGGDDIFDGLRGNDFIDGGTNFTHPTGAGGLPVGLGDQVVYGDGDVIADPLGITTIESFIAGIHIVA